MKENICQTECCTNTLAISIMQSDKVYQLLAHGRWFSPDIPASSTTKTGRHDIAEILLQVTLKYQKSKSNQSIIHKINKQLLKVNVF